MKMVEQRLLSDPETGMWVTDTTEPPCQSVLDYLLSGFFMCKRNTFLWNALISWVLQLYIAKTNLD
jgi:hypothetical protein